MKLYPIDLDIENDYKVTEGIHIYILFSNAVAEDEVLTGVYNHNYFHIPLVF